ncbi:MAG: hypothetical protein IKL47_06115 [Clostridia bacterium]|nr:hypothetical protein [Clostridia bacterium]
MLKLKNRFVYEFSEMRKELHLAEYISWWILRICMIVTAVVFSFNGEAVYARNLILLNTLATFTIPILRFISSRKIFTSKITYRCQTYIDIFILMGSFLGHGLKFLGEIHEYDKFMHFLAGGVIVFLGAEVLKAFKGYEIIPPGIKTFCGVGFSFIIIVAWELMEFFADWFITGSNNQGYYIVPDESMLFVKIFGMGKNVADQAPVFDTNADMFYAVVGCIIFTVLLFVYLHRKEQKRAVKEETANETIRV